MFCQMGNSALCFKVLLIWQHCQIPIIGIVFNPIVWTSCRNCTVNVQQVGGGAVRNFPVSPAKLNCLGFCNTTKSCVQRYTNWMSLNLHSSYSTVYFSAGLIKSLWNTESSFWSLETERMSKAGESTKEGTKGKDILQNKQLQTFKLHVSKKDLLGVMWIVNMFIQDKGRDFYCTEKSEAGTMNLKLKMEKYFLDIWKGESKYCLLLSL